MVSGGDAEAPFVKVLQKVGPEVVGRASQLNPKSWERNIPGIGPGSL